MEQLWQGLLANIGIVAILISVWAYGLDWSRMLSPRARQLAIAVAASGAAILLLSVPIEPEPGLRFDLRAVPVALAGFLGGPAVGLATGAAAALYRLHLGGIGALAGVAGIGLVTLVGVVGHLLLRGKPPKLAALLPLAAATALGNLAGLFFLPAELRRATLPDFLLPGLTLIAAATLTTGAAILTELRRRETAEENGLYRAVFDALPEPLNAKDAEGRFIAANPATAELMQADGAAALIGKTDFDFYPAEIAASFRRDEEAVMATAHASVIEQWVERKDGSSAWLSTLKAPLFDRNGRVFGLLTHNRDVTELKRLQEEHEASARLLADALANMADALAVFDRENRLVMCNEQYRRMFPKTAHLRHPGAYLGDILRASVETGEQGGVAAGEVDAWIEKTLNALQSGGDEYIQLGDGRWLHARVRPGRDGPLCVISDVTAQREVERKLSELNRRLEALASMDGLTGIANRRAFEEGLEKEFQWSARTGAPLSLILLDVDHFKAFNDTYGHPAGDDCLKAIARVLSEAARRPADLVARYGGEEFAVLLPETDAAGALAAAEAIRLAVRALAIPHAGNRPGVVTVSLGLATRAGRGGGDRAEDLVGRADEALYAAKAEGRDRAVPSPARFAAAAEATTPAPREPSPIVAAAG